MKICRVCNIEKDEKSFDKRYDASTRETRCRRCKTEARISANGPVKMPLSYSRERIRKRKQERVDYLGGKCIVCGYNKCIGALDFHHREPASKLFNLSDKLQTGLTKEITEELDKCDLLCANCHREVHFIEDLQS